MGRLRVWGQRDRSHPNYWRAWLDAEPWLAVAADVGLGRGADHCGFSISEDTDRGGWQVGVKAYRLVNLWVSVASPELARRRYWRAKARGAYRYREPIHLVHLAIHDRALWWEFLHPQHSWSRGTPRWRSGSFQFWDALVGRAVYASVPLHRAVSEIALPEGRYPVEVVLTADTWSRPRWRDLVVYRAELSSLDGLPIPGKGENSWDLGPTTLSSSTFPLPEDLQRALAATPGDAALHEAAVEAAILHVAADVVATRQARGEAPDYAER